jgi:hypothetical protein
MAVARRLCRQGMEGAPTLDNAADDKNADGDQDEDD